MGDTRYREVIATWPVEFLDDSAIANRSLHSIIFLFTFPRVLIPSAQRDCKRHVYISSLYELFEIEALGKHGRQPVELPRGGGVGKSAHDGIWIASDMAVRYPTTYCMASCC
eukprot:gene3601-2542_t